MATVRARIKKADFEENTITIDMPSWFFGTFRVSSGEFVFNTDECDCLEKIEEGC